ncbi:ImuA family protein [Paraurantiacibacter namhicola]|uniref:ImuA family protein n=1 Tax=Paraurantiacibacter namhicola TaxID=645517 RepID=UPI001F42AB5E|nr:recA-like protein [Paraurantiacibacter namhicola]
MNSNAILDPPDADPNGPDAAAAPLAGLALPPGLAEAFADFRDLGVAGFALAQVPRGGRILWVQERMAQLETGRPFGLGCQRYGHDPAQLALVCSRNTAQLLWTMEEGLRCASLSAIIGEVWGNPRALDFTATKRLAMRARRQGVQVFLLRFNASPDLSAARQRWTVRSAPSAPNPYDPSAPGEPCWQVELFRGRDMRPGLWDASYDRAAHRLDLVPAFRDPALAQQARIPQRGAGPSWFGARRAANEG